MSVQVRAVEGDYRGSSIALNCTRHETNVPYVFDWCLCRCAQWRMTIEEAGHSPGSFRQASKQARVQL